MPGQIALEPFDSGIHEPGLTVKAASPHAAALPIADVDLLPVDRGGSVPEALGSLTSLVYLGLASNQLSGTIPQALGNLTSLKRLFSSRIK